VWLAALVPEGVTNIQPHRLREEGLSTKATLAALAPESVATFTMLAALVPEGVVGVQPHRPRDGGFEQLCGSQPSSRGRHMQDVQTEGKR
jgi:hypothetical protein